MTLSKGRDDDDWLAALAGRPAAHMQADSALEARLLRDALLRTAQPAMATVAPDEAEMHDFARRLRRERASGERGCEGCAGRAERWKQWFAGHRWPLAGALASAAVIAVVVGVQRPWPAEPPVIRAPDASTVQLRADAQPQRRRDDLARRLGDLGADVRRYERLGRFGIDARFTLPLSATVARELQALGLAVDGDGVTKVEFETTAR